MKTICYLEIKFELRETNLKFNQRNQNLLHQNL